GSNPVAPTISPNHLQKKTSNSANLDFSTRMDCSRSAIEIDDRRMTTASLVCGASITPVYSKLWD
ncbi:MAG TPA: hypothetical protein P5186_14780, partial [Candidatus Paceibacterota bacterium]|nr:hypothetical protein [Verrucomicrobiota bacterium]HRY49311.1 hypothetical protein [Candidatus Paceibacterota bacterium]